MIKLIKDVKRLSKKEQVGWLIAAGLYVCFVIIPLINIFFITSPPPLKSGPLFPA